MHTESTRVGMLACPDYDGEKIGECFNRICRSLSWTPPSGKRVLLKPNLVMARGHKGLACTHPEFIAAAARFFLDNGLKVTVGDSPAFGSALQVMESCGILKALKGLDVKLVNFSSASEVQLAGGQKIMVAREVFENNLIINLPRIKAHGQLGMSLAVKNLFGLVVSWRKWLLHQSLGREVDRFLAMLADILEIIPDTFTLMDGIIAMQGTGPVRGYPFNSGIVAGSWNPVALDTVILEALSLNPQVNLLNREYSRRKWPGSSIEDIGYTLSPVGEISSTGFAVPDVFKPIPFSVRDSLVSLMQRGTTLIGR